MALISRISVLSVAAAIFVKLFSVSNHKILWLWLKAKGAAQSWS
jgi:hypothetical protein